MKNIFIAIGIFLFVMGASVVYYFSGQEGQAQPSTEVAATIVPFTILANGVHKEAAKRVNYVITSQQEMDALRAKLGVTTPFPVIDFKKQMVVAILGGTVAKADPAVSVTKIEDTTARKVFVTLRVREKSCTGAAIQKDAGPYEIIAMPATKLPLIHEDTSKVSPCGQ